MAEPIVAPYVPTYSATEPYLSVAEFKASPTGTNVNQLAPGRDATVNADVLAQMIANASSWADSICNQQLACTPVVLFGEYRVVSGRVKIPAQQLPVVQLNSASIGAIGTDMTELATLDGTTFPDPNIISVPYTASAGPVNVQIEYIAGFPNTFLAAAALAAASVLTVNGTLGIVPGARLTIYEPGATEIVTVVSTTSTTITLAAPLTKAHIAGSNVSALPPSVKQAVILLTAILIKGRGSQAIVLQSIPGGSPSTMQNLDPSSTSMLGQAMNMLNSYKRVA